MAVIRNTKSNKLLSGTSGDDEIENDGSNVTISGGKGSDTIYNGWVFEENAPSYFITA